MRDALLRLIQSKPNGATSFTAHTDRPSAYHESGNEIFNDLALKIYRYQFERNLPYQQFCRSQKKTKDIERWEEIPPLPVTAFKTVDLTCRPVDDAVRIFHSSGTTGRSIETTGGKRIGGDCSRHYLFDLQIANATILSHFKLHFCVEKKMQLYILAPSPNEAPHSSLSYMLDVIRVAYGTEESNYYIHRGSLLSEKLAYDLSEATEPVMLLGTSFSFVHFIDFHQEHAFPITLPTGSQLMDTGGFKGKSRTVSRPWLYAVLEKRLGLSPAYCVNEYGMSEMTSQFYNRGEGISAYCAPPQTRWKILSPATLQPVAKGEIGLLAFYDLANIDSVLAILTEDLGREVDDGFELIGRATDADQRGCSIALDLLLEGL